MSSTRRGTSGRRARRRPGRSNAIGTKPAAATVPVHAAWPVALGHVDAERDRLHPRADVRDERTGPQSCVRTMFERREREESHPAGTLSVGGSRAHRPRRRALLEERAHAFVGVVDLRVVDHDRARERVRLALRRCLLARRTRACRARARPGSTRRIRAASASVSASSSAPGTTRLTSPQSNAVAASIMSPVNSISSARLRPIERDTGTIGVEQNRPMFTPGVANRASSDAIARSHAATSWQPAAVATPCTFAMTGCGISCSRFMSVDAGREQLVVERVRGSCRPSRRGRARPRTRARCLRSRRPAATESAAIASSASII